MEADVVPVPGQGLATSGWIESPLG